MKKLVEHYSETKNEGKIIKVYAEEVDTISVVYDQYRLVKNPKR